MAHVLEKSLCGTGGEGVPTNYPGMVLARGAPHRGAVEVECVTEEVG